MNNRYNTVELKERMFKTQINVLENSLEILENRIDIDSIRKIENKINELKKELKTINKAKNKEEIKEKNNKDLSIENKIDYLTYAIEIMENRLEIKTILNMQKKVAELISELNEQKKRKVM